MLIFENVFKCEFIGQPHSDFFKNSIVINHQISLPDLRNKKATLKDKSVGSPFLVQFKSRII
jgi:hypothetical protein